MQNGKIMDDSRILKPDLKIPTKFPITVLDNNS